MRIPALSREEASQLALLTIDDLEQDRNPTGKKWKRPSLTSNEVIFNDDINGWSTAAGHARSKASQSLSLCRGARINIVSMPFKQK